MSQSPQFSLDSSTPTEVSAQDSSLLSLDNYTNKLINEIMMGLQLRQWESVISKLNQIFQEDIQPSQELDALGLFLVQTWIFHTQQIYLLDMFDHLVVSCMSATNRESYTSLILHILAVGLELLAKYLKQGQLFSYEGTDFWKSVVELLRTYTYSCQQLGFREQNWLICWVVTATLLDQCTFNAHIHTTKFSSQVDEIMKFLSSIGLPSEFRNQIFNTSMMTLRVFVSEGKGFMGMDNKLIKPTQKYPSVNNCSLLMKIIESQLVSDPSTAKLWRQQQWNKRDCILVLVSILETCFPKCENYNRILEYATYIVLLIQKIELSAIQNQRAKNQESKQINTISVLMFYCGQLIGLILYRNSEWLLQFCRKEANNTNTSPYKVIRNLIKVYEDSVQVAKSTMGTEFPFDDVVLKRLVLGFCGLLRIPTIETAIDDSIRKISASIIKIIEFQHGWKEQASVEDLQEEFKAPMPNQELTEQYKQEQQDKEEKKGKDERDEQEKEKYWEILQTLQKQDLKIEDSKQGMVEMKDQLGLQIDDLEWSENYYNKNNTREFEKIEEIQELIRSMWELKEHSMEIFQHFMNLFDEKQSLMWMVELERYGETKDDPQYDSD